MANYIVRVPLDFDYPLNKDWYGFYNQIERVTCPACKSETVNYNGGTGYNQKMLEFHEMEYGTDYIRETITQEELDNYYKNRDKGLSYSEHFNDKPKLTLAEFKARYPYNDVSKLDLYCLRLGYIPKNREEWHCKWCKGEGYIPFRSKELLAIEDEWENHEMFDLDLENKPPEGKGYQVWQSISTGGPISPVFETPEELAKWYVEYAENRRARSYCKDYEIGTYESFLKDIKELFPEGDKENEINE